MKDPNLTHITRIESNRCGEAFFLHPLAGFHRPSPSAACPSR
jgi:hypothetical protein